MKILYSIELVYAKAKRYIKYAQPQSGEEALLGKQICWVEFWENK